MTIIIIMILEEHGAFHPIMQEIGDDDDDGGGGAG